LYFISTLSPYLVFKIKPATANGMMKQLFKIAIVLFSNCIALPLQAFHIIGGDVTYRCFGNGDYVFTMKIYRDCSSAMADVYDQNAPITVFLGDAAPYQQIAHFYVPLQPVTRILPNLDNPCLIVPPNVCVQQGVYLFELNLPVSNASYHIVYQRCCRNSTITNITTQDEVGATFSVQLTPEAQATCNSSPVFNDFPPIVVCAGEPLNFDHSATDRDGDQLVYELCAPLEGGGTVGFLIPGDPASCLGFKPDPACPPPFNPVHYSPPFSALNPLAGMPSLSIDAVSGLITGTPTVQGQFVVGICVKEFRNGQLLSVVQRDFQFNVTFCEPTVVAKIQADSIINSSQFIVNSCGKTVDFINESFQQELISQSIWEFDIDGQTQTFPSWNAEVAFPEVGTYEGRLSLNPGTECSDSATIIVHVFPEIKPDFEFQFDTCVAGPATFTDLSVAENSNIIARQWEFGDGEESLESNPPHLYQIPGFHDVRLEITDDNGCVESIFKTIQYQPAPALIVISPSAFVGCEPASIFFDNLSMPIDETYDIRWNFGDGNTGAAISPAHVFESPGVYDISLEIVSPIGCKTDTLFPQLIEILPSPVADFSFSPENLTNLHPVVQFTDLSVGADFWQWKFAGFGSSFEQNPVFSFPDTGQQEVRLIVQHPRGCQDTLLQFIDVIPEVTYFLPNAFTPNNDGVNEFFKGQGMMAGIQNFHLQIWNRWGELIFETSDPENGWNGRKNNSGSEYPAGVYLCLVNYTGPRGKSFTFKSFATLIR